MSQVFVGKTAFPLKSSARDKGPLPLLSAPSLPPFVMLDGPPYANGLPHLGHALNKHLKDAVVRAAHVLGHAPQWRPGWDCHGLPLELAVEKLGHRRSQPTSFVQAAERYALQQARAQQAVFEQQGWCTQWDQPWHTCDPASQAQILRVFASLMERGHVCVRHTAVPWCPECQSTLASAEQETKALAVETWLVPFHLSENECVLSWTTTPWTLPLHQGLVVHPQSVYRALQKGQHRAWVSDDTAHAWAQKTQATVTDHTLLGADLLDRSYTTPWGVFVVKGDDRVLPDAGTGVLHAVMGLSALDTELGHELGWVLTEHLLPDGRVVNSPLGLQNGLQAGPGASEPVRSFFVSSPWFLPSTSSSEVAHCWRHWCPLLTRPSRQVFVELNQQVRDRAQEMVSQMSFTPPNAQHRLQTQMHGRPHWCVSRQRSWGVPLALFLDRTTGQPHVRAVEWMRAVADRVQHQGVQAWWDTPTQQWVGGQYSEQVERVDDVLDVWFDSGCVPQFVGSGDVVVEGTDQFRGWFQSCVWVAAALEAPLPFKRVVCHGFVVDEQGEKLSKSKGGDQVTRVTPWQDLPTDVVRVWSLMGQEGHDKTWSWETVSLAQKAVERLRGVLRFLLANCQSTDAWDTHDQLPAWDRFWWKALSDMHDECLQLCAQGYTGQALQRLLPFAERFSSLVFGAWKDRLYCAHPESAERRQLNDVMHQCLRLWQQLLQVVTPRLAHEAMPFASALRSHLAPPEVSPADHQQVLDVLALRQKLGPAMEEWNRQGVPVMKQRVVLPSCPWPLQWWSDALGVGQCSVDSALTEALVLPSPDEFCPRCRRPQPRLFEHHCKVCERRLALEDPFVSGKT